MISEIGRLEESKDLGEQIPEPDLRGLLPSIVRVCVIDVERVILSVRDEVLVDWVQMFCDFYWSKIVCPMMEICEIVLLAQKTHDRLSTRG